MIGSDVGSSELSGDGFYSGIIDSSDNVPEKVQEGLVGSGDGSSELSVELTAWRDAVLVGLGSVDSASVDLGLHHDSGRGGQEPVGEGVGDGADINRERIECFVSHWVDVGLGKGILEELDKEIV